MQQKKKKFKPSWQNGKIAVSIWAEKWDSNGICYKRQSQSTYCDFLKSKTFNNTPRHRKTDLWIRFEREPEYMKLSKLGHWVRADIGKINRSRCPIFPLSWKQIYKKKPYPQRLMPVLSAHVGAHEPRDTRSDGNGNWDGQEHLWHFIHPWKWCNIALTLLSPEKMNQVQTEPEPQCGKLVFEAIKMPTYRGCPVDLDHITDWWKHIKNTINMNLNALTVVKWRQLGSKFIPDSLFRLQQVNL